MASPSNVKRLPSNKPPFPSRQIQGTLQDEEQQQIHEQINMPPGERGGYDCDFVDPPKCCWQTDCPICLQILRDPLQVTCCGKCFCKLCIKRVQADRKSCPTCNEDNFGVFSDKRTQQSLCALQVWCTYQKSGCEWTGELGELDRHLNLYPKPDKQLIGCAFAAVACTRCCKYFQRRHVHVHEIDSCPQRPFSCDYCEDYCSVYEDVVNNHWPVCKCFPVPCPNKCRASPERQNVETHVNTVCPLTVINCDFHYAGCEIKLLRKDMPNHLVDSLAAHVSLLMVLTQTLTGRAEQDNLFPHLTILALQQLTQLTIQQKVGLGESQRKIQELEREKQAIEREVEVLKQQQGELEKEKQAIEREVEALKQQQGEDRASLATLHRYVGVLPVKFTLTGFEERKKSGEPWCSPPFYTHPQGYKMCLNVNANGCDSGKATHVSVFAYLMRGEFDNHLRWPFQGSVVTQLCNQLEDKRHCGHTISFSKTTNPKVIGRVTNLNRAEFGLGAPTLVAHNDLDFNPANNCQYLKDDCLHFRIFAVELLSKPGVLPTELIIKNFNKHNHESDECYSQPFYTHPRGYKMCLQVFVNGCGEGKGTHVSVYAHLMRGEFDAHLKWPFQGDITIAMLNQLEDNSHTENTIKFVTTCDSKAIGRVTDREIALSGLGYPTFIAHTELNYKPANNCQYLKYDCLRFRIVSVQTKFQISLGGLLRSTNTI